MIRFVLFFHLYFLFLKKNEGRKEMQCSVATFVRVFASNVNRVNAIGAVDVLQWWPSAGPLKSYPIQVEEYQWPHRCGKRRVKEKS